MLTALGFTTKGSRLSHAELDQNFIDLYNMQQAALKGLAEYDANKTYPLGAAAVYGGKIYQATASTTGVWNPAVWHEIPTPAASFGFPTWDNAATYALNDYVEYNLRLFRSIAAGNAGHNPETSPAWWVEVSPSAAPIIPSWAAGLYTRGQLVWFGNKAYRCAPATLDSSSFLPELDNQQWQPLDEPKFPRVWVASAGSYNLHAYDQFMHVDSTDGVVHFTLNTIMRYSKLELLHHGGQGLVLLAPDGYTINGEPFVTISEATLITVFQPYNSNYTMINSQEGGTVTQVAIDLTNYVNPGGIDAAGAVDFSVPSTAYTDQGLAYDDQVIDADRPYVRQGKKDIQVLELLVPGPNSGDQYFCALRGVPVNVGTVRLRLHPGVGNDNLVLVDQDDAAAPTIPAGAVPLRLRNDAQAVLSGAEGDFIDLSYDASQNMWFQTGGMSL
jgi:hypothetical protein